MADDLAQLGLSLPRSDPSRGCRVDSGLGQDLVGAGAPNAVDIGQADLYPLILRQVNASNTCHTVSAPPINLVSACAWDSHK